MIVIDKFSIKHSESPRIRGGLTSRKNMGREMTPTVKSKTEEDCFDFSIRI